MRYIMNTIFGISMDTIMAVTLGLFAVITAVVAALALRHRLLLALALRGIPRRRAQTALIVVGLMLGTVIITAAFGTGDTMTYSIRGVTAHNLGNVDELVVGNAVTTYTAAPMPASMVDRVRTGLASTGVGGVTGAIAQPLALQDLTTRQTKAHVALLGVPAAYPVAFGPLTDQGGAAVTLGQLGANQVYLNGAAQQALGARAGDQLRLFIGGRRVPVVVRSVLRDEGLAAGGLLSAGASADPEIVLPLDRAQALLGQPGEITAVLISNQGDALAGAALTDRVTAALQAPLADPAQAAAAKGLLDTPRGLAALGALQRDHSIAAGATAKLRDLRAQLGVPGESVALKGLLNDPDVIGALRTIADPAIAAPLNTTLAAIADERVQAVKQQGLDGADASGSAFLSIFLVFGLFSIAVGLLLIFLIFVMLAAERRAEMGMARAVGIKRRHLIEQFLFEGYAYDLGAALVGIVLGVGVGLGMVSIISSLVGSVGFTLQPHIAPRSIVVAFCLGAIVTFLTVAFSAWRVSRLNIVAAIRDLPDDLHADGGIAAAFRRPLADLAQAGRRVRAGHALGALAAALAAPWHLVGAFKVFIGRGPLLLVVGYLLLGLGIGSKQLFPFDRGVSLLLIGGAMLPRWLLAGLRVPARIRDRLGYSLAGLALVVFWLLPSDALRSDLHSGMEMFFLSGLMLVLGGVWTVVYNSDLLLGALVLTLGRIGALAPVLKTAVMYPLQNRVRTGLTLSMFSLVIFTLIAMSVLTGSFVGQGFNLDRDSGGYQIYGSVGPLNPIRDINAQIAADPRLRGRVSAAGGLADLAVGLRQPGQRGARPADQTWQPSSAHVADDAYLAGTRYTLHLRASGYGSDAQVWQAVRAHPGYAVVGAELVRAQGGFGPSGGFLIRGISYDGKSFAPVHIVMRDARTGAVIPLTVIGVLDQASLLGSGVYTARSALAAAHDAPAVPTTYDVRVAPGQDVHQVALALGAAFLANGLDVTEARAAYDKQMAISAGITTLLQGFMALGLIVGIAALGVIATRSVVERRQQIGVLRAIGYKRRMVQAGFLLESSFVSLAGTVLGVVLGLLLAQQIVTSMAKTDPSMHAIIPWARIGGIVLLAYLASLLTTYLPARQAARVAPAEALRYE